MAMRSWSPFAPNAVSMSPLAPIPGAAVAAGYNQGYTPRVMFGGGVPGQTPPPMAAQAAPTPPTQAPAQPGFSLEGLLGKPGFSDGLLAASGVLAKGAGPSRVPISTGALVGPALQAFAAGEREGELYDYKMGKLKAEDAMLKAASEGRAQLAEQYPHMSKAIVGGVVDPKDRFKEVDGVLVDTWAMQAPGAKMPEKKIDATKEYYTDQEGNQVLTRKGADKRHEEWRKFLQPTMKLVRETATAVSKVRASLAHRSGPADISAINAYQRLIDDAAVRGEDIALQASAVSWFKQLEQYKKRAQTGELLPQPIRDEMARVADSLQGATTKNAQIELNGYKRVVDGTPGLSWDKVVPSEFNVWFPGQNSQGGATPDKRAAPPPPNSGEVRF